MRRQLLVRLGLCCAAAAFVADVAVAQTPVPRAGGRGSATVSPVSRQLSRAITLFATDDDGPEAERLFKDVIRSTPVTVPDGATARYYLGRLYHRNYYMLRQPKGLDQAAERYKDVHNKGLGGERGGAWYTDARFYKCLAYLELGKWKDAYETIDHIDPALDGQIDVDYLVWSVDKRSINRRVSSAELRQRFLAVLKAQNVIARPNGADPRTTATVLGSLQRLLQDSLVKGS